MGKRTVIECDFCGKWVGDHNIHKFKETKYTWRDGWTTCKFYMCFDCKGSISEMLYRNQRKKQIEEEKEVF